MRSAYATFVLCAPLTINEFVSFTGQQLIRRIRLFEKIAMGHNEIASGAKVAPKIFYATFIISLRFPWLVLRLNVKH